MKQHKTYDSQNALNTSLTGVIDKLQKLGAERIFYKSLSPNDNSKNQIYLGCHLNEVNWMPQNNLIASSSNSLKLKSNKHKYTKSLNFKWLDCNGMLMPAPNTKLIYYPQYPEVRLSGFLQGSSVGMNGWMDESKKGRYKGRFLIIGVDNNRTLYAYLAVTGSKISSAIPSHPQVKTNGPSQQLQLKNPLTPILTPTLSAKTHLISELKRIHSKGYIAGKKLRRDFSIIPYNASNGGGYTLEAELGILPNGSAKPDFLGWEIKQFGVKKWKPSYNSEVLTLLTPEPDAGEYFKKGLEYFIRTYGRHSLKKTDRWDYTGTHRYQKLCNRTQLTLDINGFDISSGKITNTNGCLNLVTLNGIEAASWTFPKLLEHWSTKHAKAAYIPSMKKQNNSGGVDYIYSNKIRLYEGTNFEMFLSAFIKNFFYLDPACKIENISTTKKPNKKRNQFRIPWRHLDDIYLLGYDITL